MTAIKTSVIEISADEKTQHLAIVLPDGKFADALPGILLGVRPTGTMLFRWGDWLVKVQRPMQPNSITPRPAHVPIGSA